MGYILPVNHEQYNQYANRVVRKEGPHFIVKPVQKVTLRAKLKGKTDYDDKYEEAKVIKNYVIKKKNEDEELSAVHNPIEDSEADITGKGKYFNETV